MKPTDTLIRTARRFATCSAMVLALALSAHAVTAQQELKIGFSMSLTGPLAGNGKAALLAREIWREDVNAKGGILGRPVKFVYYDDQTDPATVPGIYNKLLDVDKVDLIVSSFGQAVVATAIPIAMERGMVFMTIGAINANAKFKYDRYFQAMPLGPEPTLALTQGFFDAAMTISPKPTTVALVGADAQYSHDILDPTRTIASRLGLKIVYDKTYPLNTTDYAPIVRAIQATNPDIVFLVSYPADSVGMIRAAHEVDLKTKMFGGPMAGPQYAALKTQLGPLFNGMVGMELYVPEPTLKLPTVDRFLAKYQSRAETAKVDLLGYYVPPYAYAGLEILGEAVQKVGSLDQQKIAEYIHANEFHTVVGNFRFASSGEAATTRVLFVQYHGIQGHSLDEWKQPGHFTILTPSDLSSGKLVYPYDQARR